MALNALTLAVTQGVVGRPFLSAVNGLTYPRQVEVLVDGSPGGSYVNGVVIFSSLPYQRSTIVLREYEPGVGAGYRDTRLDITAATADEVRAQALSMIGGGRTLVRYRVGSVRQPDGSYVFSVFAEDDLGATASQAVGGGSPTPTPSGAITAIAADGRSVLPSSPASAYFPDDPAQRVQFTALRQGYDASGNLVTYASDDVLLAPVPKAPYSEGLGAAAIATPNGTGYAVQNLPLYATDSIVGATNNATTLAPKPFGGHVCADRIPVFNDGSGHFYATVDIDPVALWWRFERTAPYVRCKATHVGSGQVIDWSGATWFDKFEDSGDRYAAPGFRKVFDFAGLPDGLIAVDYEIFPFVGDARSIRSTLDGDAPRGIRTLYFNKITTPTELFVASPTTGQYDAALGSDTTGTGTRGAPYETIGKALNVLGASGRDGAIITVLNDLDYGATAVSLAGATQCCVTIRKDPLRTEAVTLRGYNGGTTSTNCTFLRIQNLTVLRGINSGTNGLRFFNTNANGYQIYDNCIIDFAGATTGSLCQNATQIMFIGGTSVTNIPSGAPLLIANAQVNISLLRGFIWQLANGANTGMDIYHAFGCELRGIRSNPLSTRDYHGMTITGCGFWGLGGSNDAFTATTTGSAFYGFCAQQSSFEWTSATAGVLFGISRDSPDAYSTDSVLFRNITTAGAGIAGRRNGAYDSTVGTVREHTNWDVFGCQESHSAMKGGQFLASATDSPPHVGNLYLLLGQGYRHTVTMHPAINLDHADGDYTNTFAQIHAGLNSYAGGTLETRTDVFATHGAVTYNGSSYTAGAGSSDLRLKPGSPGHGRVPTRGLALKLDGTAAPASNDNAGCWPSAA